MQSAVVVASAADTGSRVCSCGILAELLRGTWDLLGLGIDPMSTALAYFTTDQPGNPCLIIFNLFPTKIY